MTTGDCGQLIIGEREVAIIVSWDFVEPSIIDEFDAWFVWARLRCEQAVERQYKMSQVTDEQVREVVASMRNAWSGYTSREVDVLLQFARQELSRRAAPDGGDTKTLPELSGEDRAAMESLGPDLVRRLWDAIPPDSSLDRTGVEMIASERTRQASQCGYDSSHDDDHDECELISAAVAYALAAKEIETMTNQQALTYWPFVEVMKSGSSVEALCKAGALIAAEIDRLLRAKNHTLPDDEPMTPEEADRAYDEAEAVPISAERIAEVVQYVRTHDNRDRGEPSGNPGQLPKPSINPESPPPASGQQVWIVGRVFLDASQPAAHGVSPWTFQGVFLDREKAVVACRDGHYFIAPVTIGEPFPHDPTPMPNAEFPASNVSDLAEMLNKSITHPQQ